MSNKARRFEVLLPVRFNDGREVPEELLGEAVNRLLFNLTPPPMSSLPRHFSSLGFSLIDEAGYLR